MHKPSVLGVSSLVRDNYISRIDYGVPHTPVVHPCAVILSAPLSHYIMNLLRDEELKERRPIERKGVEIRCEVGAVTKYVKRN